MKNYDTKVIIGLIVMVVSFIVAIGCGIAAVVIGFQNPDMTEYRRIIEYPLPSIIGLISLVAAYIGYWMMGGD